MNLTDFIRRTSPPAPWAEGENIPWREPGFSARMLAEHLLQDHDAASRRAGTIDRHVDWIHRAVLGGRPTAILDLGCGPGLYASRLARLGHTCTGIDFSPASIAYAAAEAAREGLACTYRQEDIREAEYGTGFGLVMLIFGELNVFRPQDARRILAKARAGLIAGGALVLEPHTFAAVQQMGTKPRSWYTSERGLFSERPHVYLQENFWEDASRTATRRYWVLDAASAGVTRYAQTLQAYHDDEYRALLHECGYSAVEFVPSLGGAEAPPHEGLFALVAR
jgi:SAM-dependent methyltransferase